MCKGRKKNPAAVLFCRCCRAASIHHPELIARERGASRHGDSAPAAITIRTGSGGGPCGRGAAAWRGQDRPEGWRSLSAVANIHRCVGAAGAGVFGGDILAVVKNTSLP